MNLSNPLRPNSVTTTTIEDGAVTEAKTDFDTTPLSVEGGGTSTNNGSIAGTGILNIAAGAGSLDDINFICGASAGISFGGAGGGPGIRYALLPNQIYFEVFNTPALGSSAELLFTDYHGVNVNATIDQNGNITARGIVSGTSVNVSDPATALVFAGDNKTNHAKIDNAGNYVEGSSAPTNSSVSIVDTNGRKVLQTYTDGTLNISLLGKINEYSGITTASLGVAPITQQTLLVNQTSGSNVQGPTNFSTPSLCRVNIVIKLHNVSGNCGLSASTTFTYSGVGHNVVVANIPVGAAGDYIMDFVGVILSDADKFPLVSVTPSGFGASDTFDYMVVFEQLV